LGLVNESIQQRIEPTWRRSMMTARKESLCPCTWKPATWFAACGVCAVASSVVHASSGGGAGGDSPGRLFAVPADETNAVVELDPTSGAELNRFATPEPSSSGPDGLAFDGQRLFFLSSRFSLSSGGSDTLYELDPETGRVIDVDVLATGVGSGDYDGLAALGGRVYILDYTDLDVHVFDPGSDRIVGRLDIDGVNPGLIVGGGLAAVASPDRLLILGEDARGGMVCEFDPLSGRLVGAFPHPLGQAGGLAVVGREVVVGGLMEGTLEVLDRQGRRQRTLTVPYGVSALDGLDVARPPEPPVPGRLFAVLVEGDAIVRVHPISGAELGRFPAPGGTGGGPDGLGLGGQSLYFVSAAGGNTLYEIDAETGVVRDSDAVAIRSGEIDGLAVLGGLVFLLDYGDSDIHVFDPRSDAIVRTLDVDAANPGLELGGGLAAISAPDRLLVTGRDSGNEKVFEIDPARGTATASFAPGIAMAGGLAVLGQEIYVADLETAEHGVFRRDGTRLRTLSLRSGASALAGSDGVPLGVQRPGDCNQDRALDISDGVCLLNFLFTGTRARLPCGSGLAADRGNVLLLDVNGDDVVDLSDAVRLFGFLFLGLPPPVQGTDCMPIEDCPEIASRCGS
jgi:outer membrane protein assembly factor BamB